MSIAKPVTIAHNPVVAKLIDPERQAKLEVQQILSYAVSGADQTDAFKTTSWDGRSSFMRMITATFPAGFVTFVAAHLRRRGYTVNVVRKPLPAALGPAIDKLKVDSFAPDPRYAYQAEIVAKLERHGAMIARVATGGGKSRIAKLCYQRLGRPTLFLTTRSILMYQMAKSFKELGATPGLMGDDNWSPRSNGVTCGMVQTLTARLEDLKLEDHMAAVLKKTKGERGDKEVIAEAQRRHIAHTQRRDETIRVLANFEFVIGEEAHEVSSDSYFTILQHCKNAHYRLALTATPFMKADEEANMMLMAAFGPIGYTVSEKQLIDCGILAKPIFKYIDIPDAGKPRLLFRTTPWQGAYRIGIVEAEFRNRAVVFEAQRAASHGLPVIALVQHQAHGKRLLAMLEEQGVRAEFIWGESTQPERQAALDKLKAKKIQVLIGSTILDVGVDVPSVGMVILAGGGKAEVALRQRIGRGLREKRDGSPNQAFVVDFMDPHNNHLRSHYMQRRSIVDDTPGFKENVLSKGLDFDFSPYQRKEAA